MKLAACWRYESSLSRCNPHLSEGVSDRDPAEKNHRSLDPEVPVVPEELGGGGGGGGLLWDEGAGGGGGKGGAG